MVGMEATVNDRPFVDVNPKVVFVEKVNLVNKTTKITKEGKFITFDLSNLNTAENSDVIVQFANDADVMITDLGTNVDYNQSPEEIGKVFGKSLADFLEKDNTVEAIENICKLNDFNSSELYSRCYSFNKAYKKFNDNTYAFGNLGDMLRANLKSMGLYGDTYSPAVFGQVPENDKSGMLNGLDTLIPLVSKVNRYSDVVRDSLETEVKNNPQAFAHFKQIDKVMKNSMGNMYKAMQESLKVKGHLDDADYVELQMKIYDTAERIVLFEDTFHKKCKEDNLPFTPVSMYKMKDHRNINYQFFDIVDSIWELGSSIQDVRKEIKFAKIVSEQKHDFISESVRNSFRKEERRNKEIDKMGVALLHMTDLFSNVVDSSFDKNFGEELKVVSFVGADTASAETDKVKDDAKTVNKDIAVVQQEGNSVNQLTEVSDVKSGNAVSSSVSNKKVDYQSVVAEFDNIKQGKNLLLSRKMKVTAIDKAFESLVRDEFEKIDNLPLLEDQRILLKKATEFSVEHPNEIKGVKWFNFSAENPVDEFFRFSEALEKTNFHTYMHEKIDNKASELLCGLSVRYDKKGNAQFFSYSLDDSGCHRYLLGKKANVYEALMSNATSLYWNGRSVSKDNYLEFDGMMKNVSMIPVIIKSTDRMLSVCNDVFHKSDYKNGKEVVLDKNLIDNLTRELDKKTRKSIKDFRADRKKSLKQENRMEAENPMVEAVKQQLYQSDDTKKSLVKTKANLYEKGFLP